MPEKKEATKLHIALGIAFLGAVTVTTGYALYGAGSLAYTQLDNMVHKNNKAAFCDKKNTELLARYRSKTSALTKNFPGAGKVQVGMRYIMSEDESTHWRKTLKQRRCNFVGLNNY